jgi:hypothetical protein
MQFISWAYRQVFDCCRRVDKILFKQPDLDIESVPFSKLPWLWIGAVYPNGKSVDHTNAVNNAAKMGLRVTPELLDCIFNTNDVQWRYLDPKSLEEKEFPSDGFVIDNASVSEGSTVESHSTNDNADHTE